MGRRTVHDTDTQTSPWASQCVSRSSEPQISDSENRMESESSRSTACIPACIWGSPHVDLFALKCKTKLATYMSPIPEPDSWKVDSLVQSWEYLYAYAYPPTALIRQTLNKLILHRAEQYSCGENIPIY